MHMLEAAAGGTRGALSGAQRAAGLTEPQAEEAATALSAVPSISVCDVLLHVRPPALPAQPAAVRAKRAGCAGV